MFAKRDCFKTPILLTLPKCRQDSLYHQPSNVPDRRRAIPALFQFCQRSCKWASRLIVSNQYLREQLMIALVAFSYLYFKALSHRSKPCSSGPPLLVEGTL
jgi:hypothetical protein